MYFKELKMFVWCKGAYRVFYNKGNLTNFERTYVIEFNLGVFTASKTKRYTCFVNFKFLTSFSVHAL